MFERGLKESKKAKVNKEGKQAIKKRCPYCGHPKAWSSLTRDDYTCTKCMRRFK